MFRYLLTRDAVDLGLGQLSAASGVAVRGQANRYAVNIASTRSEPVNVTLAIDIGANTNNSAGAYSSYSARTTGW